MGSKAHLTPVMADKAETCNLKVLELMYFSRPDLRN